MRLLICFALKEEAAPFRKMAAGTVAAAPAASILITGIGSRNAEKSAREFLAANSPELVLTCGFAGGLNPDLKPGDVVFETANAPLAPSLSPPGGERVSVRMGEGNFPGVRISFSNKKPRRIEPAGPGNFQCD